MFPQILAIVVYSMDHSARCVISEYVSFRQLESRATYNKKFSYRREAARQLRMSTYAG